MRKGVIALLVLAACAGSTGAPSEWVEHESMSMARSEHSAVLMRDEIVVVGGLVESGFGRSAVTGGVEAYDPASDVWRPLPELPSPRHHVMATVIDDRLLVIGGLAETGFDPVDTAWELRAGRWVDRASLPTLVGSGAAVTLHRHVYVVGGVPSGGLLRYDPAEDTWVTLTPPRLRREHLAAVVFAGEIWAIAGRWEGQAYRSTEIYDPASDAWRDGPNLVEARSGFGATVVGESIIVAGGEVFDPVMALSSVERFEVSTGEWTLAKALPDGLHGNPLVAVGATVYLPGGSTRAAGIENEGRLFSLTLD